jgi:hypothetical protein
MGCERHRTVGRTAKPVANIERNVAIVDCEICQRRALHTEALQDDRPGPGAGSVARQVNHDLDFVAGNRDRAFPAAFRRICGAVGQQREAQQQAR